MDHKNKSLFFASLLIVFNSTNAASLTEKLGFPLKQIQKNATATNQSEPNFSGMWIGKCSDDPLQNKLKIRQTPMTIEIDGEEFYINGSHVYADAFSATSKNSIYLIDWNENKTALLFNTFNVGHVRKKEHSYAMTYYNKSRFYLENGRLIVKGKYIVANNASDDIEVESYQCAYDKQ